MRGAHRVQARFGRRRLTRGRVEPQRRPSTPRHVPGCPRRAGHDPRTAREAPSPDLEPKRLLRATVVVPTARTSRSRHGPRVLPPHAPTESRIHRLSWSIALRSRRPSGRSRALNETIQTCKQSPERKSLRARRGRPPAAVTSGHSRTVTAAGAYSTFTPSWAKMNVYASVSSWICCFSELSPPWPASVLV